MPGRRVVWFGLGAVTGAAGTVYGYVRAREAARVRPDEVADALVGAARAVGGGLRELVDDSREAIREAEDELRGSLAARRAAEGRVAAPATAAVADPVALDERRSIPSRNRRRRGARRSVG